MRAEHETQREGMRRRSYALAFCSLMAALGAALMMSGGLVPIMTYCSPLIAGVLLIPVLREYGAGRAWMVWAVTAALSLMLSADKEAAFFYLFLGYYPILKPLFDRIRPRAAAVLAKLLFFAAALAAMYALVCLVLRIDVGTEELMVWGEIALILFFVMLTAVMLIYDYALRNLTLLYEYRLRAKLGLPKR